MANKSTRKEKETPSLEDRYVPLGDLLTREPKRTLEFGGYFFFSVFLGSFFFLSIFWCAWVVGKIARSAGWERARASRAGVKVSGGGGSASASAPGARRGHARVSLLLFLLILSRMMARARACMRSALGGLNATCPLCNACIMMLTHLTQYSMCNLCG